MAAEDPVRALCYHALLAAAHTAGSPPQGHCAREWALAPGMARMVLLARGTVAFIEALAEARDAVTRRHLVSSFVASQDNGVCFLFQDILVAWLNAPECTVQACWNAAHRALSDAHVAVEFTPDAQISVRDVFSFALPVLGAFSPESSLPVCTDTHAVQLFKKVTLLLYLTQYHPPLQETVYRVEALVENSVRGGLTPAVWWEGICGIVCPMLWVCLKLDATALMTLCATVQADTATWREHGLAPAYPVAGVDRLLGDAVPERVETEYVVAALTEYIAKTYRGQKVMNPTSAQRLPYMLLIAAKMRLHRLARGPAAHEEAYPGWTDAAQVAPHSLVEAVTLAGGRGVLVQDATRRHSFAMGLTADGGFFARGSSGEVDAWGAGDAAPNFDAEVAAVQGGSFWRASIVAHAPDGAHADRAAFLRAVLAADGLRTAWVEPQRTDLIM